MKISKERLIEIIKEELIKENEAQDVSMPGLRGSKSSSAFQQQSAEAGRSMANSAEITDSEQNIIGRMMDLLEIAAVELDIDQGDTYTILTRAYKLIAKVVQNDREQQNEQS